MATTKLDLAGGEQIQGALPLANGGTGGTDQASAQSGLGLVPGTNVQAHSSVLDTWATKTAPSGAPVGTTDSQALTNKDLTGAGNTFPTLNQNTTGTAAGITGKTTPSGALVGTTDTQVLTHKDLTDPSNTFPSSLGGAATSINSTATAGGTTTLTSTSNQIQVFTGSTTQTVVLPTTSVTAAMQWEIINLSTGLVTVQSSSGTTALVLAPNTSAVFTAAINTPVNPTNWDILYGAVSISSGKVLQVANSLTLSAFDGASFQFGNTPTSITTPVGVSTTQIVVASYVIPANTLVAGMAFQFEVFGTQATTGTVTYYLCIGTNNSSADTVLSTIALSNTSGFGANFEGMATVRSVGSSGSMIANSMMASGTSATASTTANSFATTATTIDTTSQLYLTIQCKTSAGTQTVQQAFISACQL